MRVLRTDTRDTVTKTWIEVNYGVLLVTDYWKIITVHRENETAAEGVIFCNNDNTITKQFCLAHGVPDGCECINEASLAVMEHHRTHYTSKLQWVCMLCVHGMLKLW